MRSKLLDESNGQKIFSVVLQPGDGVKDALIRFANAENIMATSFTAIGAFERTTIGRFDIQFGTAHEAASLGRNRARRM